MGDNAYPGGRNPPVLSQDYTIEINRSMEGRTGKCYVYFKSHAQFSAVVEWVKLIPGRIFEAIFPSSTRKYWTFPSAGLQDAITHLETTGCRVEVLNGPDPRVAPGNQRNVGNANANPNPPVVQSQPIVQMPQPATPAPQRQPPQQQNLSQAIGGQGNSFQMQNQHIPRRPTGVFAEGGLDDFPPIQSFGGLEQNELEIWEAGMLSEPGRAIRHSSAPAQDQLFPALSQSLGRDFRQGSRAENRETSFFTPEKKRQVQRAASDRLQDLPSQADSPSTPETVPQSLTHRDSLPSPDQALSGLRPSQEDKPLRSRPQTQLKARRRSRSSASRITIYHDEGDVADPQGFSDPGHLRRTQEEAKADAVAIDSPYGVTKAYNNEGIHIGFLPHERVLASPTYSSEEPSEEPGLLSLEMGATSQRPLRLMASPSVPGAPGRKRRRSTQDEDMGSQGTLKFLRGASNGKRNMVVRDDEEEL